MTTYAFNLCISSLFSKGPFLPSLRYSTKQLYNHIWMISRPTSRHQNNVMGSKKTFVLFFNSVWMCSLIRCPILILLLLTFLMNILFPTLLILLLQVQLFLSSIVVARLHHWSKIGHKALIFLILHNFAQWDGKIEIQNMRAFVVYDMFTCPYSGFLLPLLLFLCK